MAWENTSIILWVNITSIEILHGVFLNLNFFAMSDWDKIRAIVLIMKCVCKDNYLLTYLHSNLFLEKPTKTGNLTLNQN